MSRINVNIRLRPVRFAFLVRPNDKRKLLEIFRINSSIWGGKFNPIIPYFKQVPSWWDRDRFKIESATQILNGYLDFFEPDFIVEAERGLADEIGFDKKRIIQLSDILESGDDWDMRGYGLNVFELYHDLYEKEFQFSRRHNPNIIDVYSDDSSFINFCSCVFGSFSDAPNLDYIKNAFNEAFNPQLLSLNGKSLSDLYRTDFTSILRLGHSKIDVRYHDRTGPILFVLNAYESRDLIDFWNLRIINRDVLPIPIQWIKQLSSYCKEFINANHRPLPGNKNGVMIDSTILFSRSVPSEDINHLVTNHFRTKQVDASVVQTWYPPIWRSDPDFVVRRIRATLSASQKAFDIDVKDDSTELTFDCLFPDFVKGYGNEYRCDNVIRIKDWSYTNRIATVFPINYKESDFPKISIGYQDTISTTEGIVIFPKFKNASEYWNLTNGPDVISKWLLNQGIKNRTSDAGRATQQIIQTLGGFFGVKNISNPGIVKLLDKISRTSMTRSAHSKEFRDRINSAIRNNPWEQATFANLVERHAVELGLEVRCSKCSNWTWYSLKQLDYQLTCDLCLRDFSFPIVNPGHGSEARWAYRLVGPFALPDYAQGGYSASLSIRFFAQVLKDYSDIAVAWSGGQELDLSSNNKI